MSDSAASAAPIDFDRVTAAYDSWRRPHRDVAGRIGDAVARYDAALGEATLFVGAV